MAKWQKGSKQYLDGFPIFFYGCGSHKLYRKLEPLNVPIQFSIENTKGLCKDLPIDMLDNPFLKTLSTKTTKTKLDARFYFSEVERIRPGFAVFPDWICLADNISIIEDLSTDVEWIVPITSDPSDSTVSILRGEGIIAGLPVRLGYAFVLRQLNRLLKVGVRVHILGFRFKKQFRELLHNRLYDIYSLDTHYFIFMGMHGKYLNGNLLFDSVRGRGMYYQCVVASVMEFERFRMRRQGEHRDDIHERLHRPSGLLRFAP